MASLRTLLDYADLNDVPPATYVGENAHQILFRGNHCRDYNSSENYNWQCFTWCVPNQCICKVRFELWGGGGNGSGSCCCGLGSPGQSGQYVECTVCAASVAVNALDGFPYSVSVASGTCRSPGMNGGFDGCKSFITGCGLDNFCACGGCHGNSACFGMNYCGTRSVNTCGPQASSCRWQTEKFVRPDSTGYRSTQSLCEAAGKDFWGGGMSYQQQEYQDGNHCWAKMYAPFGARLSTGVVGAKFGVLLAQRHVATNSDGSGERLWYSGNNIGMSSDCWRSGPPGIGGVSANAQSNNCYCGTPGAHGLVRITWFCKI